MPTKTTKRIGWVVTDQLESMPYWPRIDTGVGGIVLARMHWIARRVNARFESGLLHEIYKPWRAYDALIFLKSIGQRANRLARKYLARGKPIIFDININYFLREGVEHYQGMFPNQTQQADAILLAQISSGVIADSEYICKQSQSYNNNVVWIPDSVEMDSVPALRHRPEERKLRLVWSGDAVKLFEFLVIETTLRRYSSYLKLVLVTSDMSVMSRWPEEQVKRIEKLFGELDVTIYPYKGIEDLFEKYCGADVVISPRFLDNSYNLGHTEWKLTLGMACGCVAVASSVPSYQTVQSRSISEEIILCSGDDQWCSAFDYLLGNRPMMDVRQDARSLVDKYYSSRVISSAHSAFLNNLFGGT